MRDKKLCDWCSEEFDVKDLKVVHGMEVCEACVELVSAAQEESPEEEDEDETNGD